MGGLASVIAPVVGIASSLLGAKKQRKAISSAQASQERMAREAQERVTPYATGGEQAQRIIQDELSTGTLGGSFAAPDLASDPGYQFRLQQGQQALERQQAARGDLYSGQAGKELQRFSQELAQQEYDDAYQRWLQQQKNRYNILSGQSQQGYGAASGQGQMDLEIGDTRAQATLAKERARAQGVGGALAAAQDPFDGFGKGFGSLGSALQLVGGLVGF